jgi:hypothetical protein
MLLLGLLRSSYAGVGTQAQDFTKQMREVISLTKDNYNQITDVKIGFVVTFGAGPAPDDLAAVAESVEGLAKVGHVDTDKETDLLEILELTAETAPAARGKNIGEGVEFADFESAVAGDAMRRAAHHAATF